MTFALTGVKPTVIGNNGASIGVWGSQEASAATGAANDAKTLKKSFVVAFDTYPNQNELDHSIWPGGGGPVRQYLAHGYPNQPSAYTTLGFHLSDQEWHWTSQQMLSPKYPIISPITLGTPSTSVGSAMPIMVAVRSPINSVQEAT